MTTQETEAKKEKPQKTAQNVQAVLEETKEAFSLQNLTISLFSALLVIGVGYGSSFISTLLQGKMYASKTGPIISLVFTLAIFIAYFWSVLGPAMIYSLKSKNWKNLVYIVLLEIVWFAIFLTVLYFTTADAAPSLYNTTGL